MFAELESGKRGGPFGTASIAWAGDGELDLVIKGGRVIDIEQNIDGINDVGILNGRIALIAPSITTKAREVFDAKGLLVTPGLVDHHCHVYAENFHGLTPDDCGVLSGCSSVFDGGSPGMLTFPDFRDRYIRKAKTNTYVFLMHHPVGQYMLTEVWNHITIRPELIAECIRENRGIIVGLKNRLTAEFIRTQGVAGLRSALDICAKTGVPFSAHIGIDNNVPGNPYAKGESMEESDLNAFMFELLKLLRPGDIICHAFTCKPGRIFREDGLFDDAIRAAVRRGVVLDGCPGRTNFDLDVYKLAVSRGFGPDILSTDLIPQGLNEVSRNMGNILSRFMAHGMSLHEVLACATIKPAKLMNMTDRMGVMRPGMPADVTVSELRKGTFTFRDRVKGQTFTGTELLVPKKTIVCGEMFDVKYAGEPND